METSNVIEVGEDFLPLDCGVNIEKLMLSKGFNKDNVYVCSKDGIRVAFSKYVYLTTTKK